MVISVGRYCSHDDAQAAEWAAQPSLGIKGVYNSNLLLSAVVPASVYGHWVSPGLTFSGSTELLEISGKAAADFIRYHGDQEVSITNLYFPMMVRYKGERDNLTLNGGLIRDNTLLGELLQTGAVLTFTQRDRWDVNPSWTHALTENLSTQVTYQFNDVTYENGRRLGLFDYRFHTATVGGSYLVTEKDQLQMSGIYTTFSVPDALLTSSIYGAQVSATHMFTDTFTATASGGPRLITSDIDLPQGTVSDQSMVWVANGSLERRFETFSIIVDGGRDIFPSGFGLLLRTDRVGASVTKELSEAVTASVGGRVYFVEGVATQAAPRTITPSRFFTVNPQLTWKVNDWWNVNLSYIYSRRDVDNSSVSVDSNAVALTLTYFPPKLSISR